MSSKSAVRSTFKITGMTCGSCESVIREAVLAMPAVAEAAASKGAGSLTVTADRPVSAEEIAAALAAHPKYAVAPLGAAFQPSAARPVAEPAPTYRPLFLLVGYLALAAMAASWAGGSIDWHRAMRYFMAGFFLSFSYFKFLDLRAFAASYRSYDILAKWWPSWGLIYPFIEASLGFAYLLHWRPFETNIATLLLMLVGAAGVAQTLRRGQKIQCACLGTVFNLPMSKITLIEDLTMAAMAAAMLAW